MKRVCVLLIAVFSVSVPGQQASIPSEGSVVNGVYTNRFFGFSYTYPKGWLVHGESLQAEVERIGKEKIVDSGALKAEEADRAMKQTFQLLTASRHPFGIAQTNAVVQLIAEDVRDAPAVGDGKAYLLAMRAISAKAGAQFTRAEPTLITISGRKFFRDDQRMQINNGDIYQAMVMTVERGYALGFIFTTTDMSNLEELVSSVKTLTFRSASAH